MPTYHINPVTGTANKCDARKGNCPFGGPTDHFESLKEARENYERIMAPHLLIATTTDSPKHELREQLINEAEKEQLIAHSPPLTQKVFTFRESWRATAKFLEELGATHELPSEKQAFNTMSALLLSLEETSKWDTVQERRMALEKLLELGSDFSLRGETVDSNSMGFAGHSPWHTGSAQIDFLVEGSQELLTD